MRKYFAGGGSSSGASLGNQQQKEARELRLVAMTNAMRKSASSQRPRRRLRTKAPSAVRWFYFKRK